MTDRLRVRAAAGVSIIGVLVTSTACTVEGWRVTRAEEICARRGGVDSIQTPPVTVVCRDGFNAYVGRKHPDDWTLPRAEAVCANRGGVSHINYTPTTNVVCRSGHVEYIAPENHHD